MVQWLFTLNDQVLEREGKKSVAAILAVLRDGAEGGPGNERTHIEASLAEA